MDQTRVFGPVPSRHLGKIAGINNIPPQICTYSCVYCQLGKSLKMVADIEADILSITSVHPMREDAINAYLKKANGHFSSIEKLLDEKKIIVSKYNNERFYIRVLTNRGQTGN